MRKLTMMLAVLAAAAFWGTVAQAQMYSALDDHPGAGPHIGLGGLVISGDTPSGGSESEFLPTVSLTGMADFAVWQVFYGFGDNSSAFGGSLDYVIADNWDECSSCEDSLYWFGAGASLISYTDLFADGTGASVDDTDIGVNIGGGTRWDEWGLDAYLHYFPSNEIFAFQAALLYNFSN